MHDHELHLASPELALALLPLISEHYDVDSALTIERLADPSYSKGVRLSFQRQYVWLGGLNLSTNPIRNLADARLAVLRILNPEEIAA